MISTLLPEWLTRLPLGEVTHQLARGSLLPSLQDYMRGEREEDCLTGINLRQELYVRRSVFLMLTLSFERSKGEAHYEKELILQYPLQKGPSSDRMIRSWYYPEDPEVPTLSKIRSCHTFLQKTSWDKPWEKDRIFPPGGEIFVQRLQYNPGRRATFLLSSPRSERDLILKVVDPGTFGQFLVKAEAMTSSSLHNRLLLPRLVTYSTQESAFLYEHIPGRRIDKLDAEEMKTIRPSLFEETVLILQEIHRTSIPSLPLWDPVEKEIDRLRCSLECLEMSHPKISALIWPLSDKIFRCFTDNIRDYTQIIHNSFLPKHILYNANGDPSTHGTLAIIDWDSSVLGPPEKDIAWFLARFSQRGEECQSFIHLYETLTNRPLDRTLLNSFFQYQCLHRICKQIHRNGSLDETLANALRETADKLDYNPLAG